MSPEIRGDRPNHDYPQDEEQWHDLTPSEKRAMFPGKLRQFGDQLLTEGIDRWSGIGSGVRMHPVLGPEKEEILFGQVRRGDYSISSLIRNTPFIETITDDLDKWLFVFATISEDNVRNIVVACNRNLVWRTAMRYKTIPLPLEDRVAGGAYGLMRAMDLYQPERGTRFSSIAGWYILAGIQQVVKEKWGLTVYTQRNIARMRYIEYAHSWVSPANPILSPRELRQQLWANATTRGRRPYISPHAIPELLSLRESAIFGQSSEVKNSETIGQDDSGMDSDALARPYNIAIKAALNGLTPKQQFIIRSTFSVLGTRSMTLHEIGSKLRLDDREVRAQLAQALESLRQSPLIRALVEPGNSSIRIREGMSATTFTTAPIAGLEPSTVTPSLAAGLAEAGTTTAKVRLLVEAGFDHRAISRMLGITPKAASSCVSYLVVGKKITRQMTVSERHLARLKPHLERIKYMRGEGLPTSDIAEAIDWPRSPSRLRTLLNELEKQGKIGPHLYNPEAIAAKRQAAQTRATQAVRRWMDEHPQAETPFPESLCPLPRTT